MEERPRVRPFQQADGQARERSDESTARDRWAQASEEEAALQRSQARRLIGRRPLLRGLGAGAGLLIATGGDLRAALLVPTVALGQTTSDPPTTTFFTTTPPPFTTSTTTDSTHTTPSNDDNTKKKSNNEKQFTNTSGDDDHRIEGKIKAINLDGSTPTITIFGKDGDIVLELRGDAANYKGKVGDYISAYGEKVHEQLYEIEFVRKE